MDLVHRIHADFRYESGATTVKTTLPEVLERRAGVCQDFAHLAVGCLRSMGLAARYVSGYLETAPPPGRPKLLGADASHAWASVLVPGGGWVSLDPTNDQLLDGRYVTTAWGRDYSDVPPLKGVIFTESTTKHVLAGPGRRHPRRAGPGSPPPDRTCEALDGLATVDASQLPVVWPGGECGRVGTCVPSPATSAAILCSSRTPSASPVGAALGYSREEARVVALDPQTGTYAGPDGRTRRVCANLSLAGLHLARRRDCAADPACATAAG